MPLVAPRRRTLWHGIAVASVAMLTMCVAGWAISLVRTDVLTLRVKGSNGVGVANRQHCFAFGWTEVPPFRGSRLAWHTLPRNAVFKRGWFDATWGPREYSLLMPWAVPAVLLTLLAAVAFRQSRRDRPASFEVVVATPTDARPNG